MTRSLCAEARLVKLMPELMILVKGMLVACRSVFFTLLLLLLITLCGGCVQEDFVWSVLSS